MQQGVSKRFGKEVEYADVFIMVKFGQVVVVRGNRYIAWLGGTEGQMRGLRKLSYN